ncbi:MAG: hypothetical protein JWL87_359 [Candidatus Adlerbacteria bacterium]|nr:hypothetical protein [Candidatus Adlerbacteria bacterium]
MSAYDGYTGRLLEDKVLGRCTSKHRGYMRWSEAAAEVRKSQPAAKAAVAASLEQELRRKLPGVDVRFYTAVGSTLDLMHSVDGFFVFEGVVTVTIDLTMNPNKDACKADVLVTADDLESLSIVAHRVARELQTKLERM